MSLEDTTNTIASIIPVVVTAGVAMKMFDWMGSKMQQQPVQRPARKKKNVYSRGYSGPFGGNFSNIGW